MYLELEMGIWISLPTFASLRQQHTLSSALGKAGRPRGATTMHGEVRGRSRKKQGMQCGGGGNSPAVLSGQRPRMAGEAFTGEEERKCSKRG